MRFNDHITYQPGSGFSLKQCKSCGHKFPPPPPYPSNYGPGNTPLAKVTFDALYATYTTAEEKWEADVMAHLATHPLAKCEFCDTVVKKPALKSHQKSFGCTEMRRHKIMEDKGYKEVEGDYRLLEQCANTLASRFMHASRYSNDYFDDEGVRYFIMSECEEAKRHLRELGGIKLAYTKYNKINPNIESDHPDQGWQLRAWAPRDTVAALKNIMSKWTKLDYREQYDENNAHVKMDCYYRMWEWLQSDEDMRFAMIGLWELADAPL